MKTNYILLLAAAAALAFSCAKEKEGLPEEQAGERVTIKVSHGSEWDTKVSMTEASDRKSMSLAWESTDKLSVNGEEFTVKAIVSAHEAEFEGTSPGSGPYTIIYPGKYADAAAFNARSYAGQKQTANASTAHLEYNAMLSGVSECAEPKFDPAWAAAKGGSLQQNGVIHLLLQLPDAVTTVNAVTLAASRAVFPTTNAGDAKVSEQTLSMNGVVPNNRIVEAYMMFSAAGVEFQAGDILTVAVDTPDAMYYRVLSPMTAQTWTGGGQYTIQCKVITENNFEINNVSELEEFRDGVNSGSFLWQHCHATLNSDINCSGISEWTSIGNGSIAASKWTHVNLTTSGPAFKGIFDGQNHSITNLAMNFTSSGSYGCYGFFGIIDDGATVKNLNFATSCSMNVSASYGACFGVLAGLVKGATIENVNNYAPITGGGTNSLGNNNAAGRTMVGAIIGEVHPNKVAASIKNLHNYAEIGSSSKDFSRGNNAGNGANGFHVGGIAGFSTNVNNKTLVSFENCVNDGNIYTNAGRSSGIVAAANRYTKLKGCINNGNVVSSVNGTFRLGNITCIAAEGSELDGCINYGDLTALNCVSVAGVICFVNHETVKIKNCASLGATILGKNVNLSGTQTYNGVLFGYCNNNATFSGCRVSGAIGTTAENKVVLTAGNYFQFTGQGTAKCTSYTTANITFAE